MANYNTTKSKIADKSFIKIFYNKTKKIIQDANLIAKYI